MKKFSKKNKSIFDIKVTLTVDEKLDKLDLDAMTAKKVAEANEYLRKAKLPDKYYNK